MMWMMMFMALPLLGIAYVAWHVWVLLPLPALWKWIIVTVGVASFLLLFFGIGRKPDGFPLPVAQVLYEVGTTWLMAFLFFLLLFLLLFLLQLLLVYFC